VALGASLMQDGVPSDVLLVDIVVVVGLKQVDKRFNSVVLYAHKQHILIFGSAIAHVGPALLQELDHLQVAMQGRIEQGNVALLVG